MFNFLSTETPFFIEIFSSKIINFFLLSSSYSIDHELANQRAQRILKKVTKTTNLTGKKVTNDTNIPCSSTEPGSNSKNLNGSKISGPLPAGPNNNLELVEQQRKTAFIRKLTEESDQWHHSGLKKFRFNVRANRSRYF